MDSRYTQTRTCFCCGMEFRPTRTLFTFTSHLCAVCSIQQMQDAQMMLERKDDSERVESVEIS